MSDHFLTQLDENQPHVVLIHRSQALIELLSEWFEEAGLPIKTLSPSEFLEDELPSEIYKLIWIVDPHEGLAPEFDDCVAALSKRSEPKVVLFLGTTPLSTVIPEWEDWTSFTHLQEKTWGSLKKQLSKSVLVFIQDLWSYSLSSPLLYYLCESVSDGELKNPELDVFPQTDTELEQHLRPLLFRPNSPTSLLIKGPKYSTTNLSSDIAHLFEQTRNQELSIQKIPAQLAKIEGFAHTLQVEERDRHTYLSQVVAQLPSVTKVQKTPELEAPAFVYAKPEVPMPSKNPARQPEPETISSVSETVETIYSEPEPQIVHKPKPKPTPEPKKTIKVEELEQSVLQLFSEQRSEEKIERVKHLATETKTVIHVIKRKKRLFFTGLFLAGIFAGTVGLAALYGISLYLAHNSFFELLASNTKPLTQTQWRNSGRVNAFLTAQTKAYSSIVSLPAFDEAEVVGTLNTQIIQVQPALELWRQSVHSFMISVLSGQGSTSLDTIQAAATKTQALYEELSLLQAHLKEYDTASFTPAEVETLEAYQAYLTKERKSLAVFQQIQPLLSNTLGYQTPKTYAVLFQNPQELRPSGGFIQAVALMTFDKGNLIDTQVLNVYDLDSRLSGSVKPPEDITRYLGEQNWYLRDSNWDPHFPAVATQVAWFIENTTSKKVDGVIGFNAFALQDLIKALGPIDLPEYNEVITDRNVLERLEFHSEIKFSPEEVKKEYSTLLFNKVLARLAAVQADKLEPVLQSLNTSLATEQMLVSTFSPSEASVLNSLGWDGAMVTPQCPAQFSADTCVVDTMAQIEANVGINKANYHLERKTNHKVDLKLGTAIHTRTITYTNTAASPAWPKGAYKGYIRFYLPANAQLVGVKYNQQLVASNLLVQRTEQNRQMVGLLIEVPVQQSGSLELQYTTPLPASSNFTYSFFDQKQSGIASSNLTLSFTHDPQLQPVLIAPQAQVIGSTITFAVDGSTHAFVGTQFK